MDTENQPSRISSCFLVHWKGWILALLPVLYGNLVLIFGDHVANRMVYMNLVMLIAFISEALPVGLICLLPIGFFPLQNILPSEEVCFTYFHPLVAELILGMLILTSLEATKFHQREALVFIHIFGANVKSLHVAIVVMTTVLSIALSNGIAAAIMFFLTRAILQNLESMGVCQLHTEESNDEVPMKKKPSSIVLGFYLSIAYAASLAGGCTLSSTTANTIMRDMYDKQFPNSEETVSFEKFLRYGMPPSLLNILLVTIYMQVLYFGVFRPRSPEAEASRISPEAKAAAIALNRETLDAMGPMNVAQFFSLLVLAMACGLMMTRQPEFTAGWAEQFNQEVLNSSPLAFSVVIMFMLPAGLNFLLCWDEKSTAKTPGLLTWKVANNLVPWELIFVIGFSATLELAFKKMKFNQSLGGVLTEFRDSEKPQMGILKVILFMVGYTNYICNFAAMSGVAPGLMELALKSKVHPLYYLLPGCLASSLSFLLPMSSMPISLVKQFVNIPTFDMMRRGLGPLLISTIVVYIWATTVGLSVYELKKSPTWLTPTNMDIKYPFK